MSLFPPEEIEAWNPDDLRSDLASADFGPELFQGVEEGSRGIARFVPGTPEQEILLRLFVEGGGQLEEKVRMALPRSFNDLVELGLLKIKGRGVCSEVRLRAMDGGLFADDFPQRLEESPGDFVMGVAQTTRMVKALLPPGRYERILDLCCGGGWLALGLKSAGSTVVGSDINARALGMARLNARINGVAGVDWREGTWYDPVEGETFDLIISNPPFVVSPGEQSVALDTGDHAGVMPSVLGDLSSRLNPGGVACMLWDWPFETVDDCNKRVLDSWNRDELQAILFEVRRQSPGEYARHWVGQDPRFTDDEVFDAEVDRWVRFLVDRGYEGVSSGFTVMRKCQPGQEWLVEESRELDGFNGDTGRDVGGIFKGKTWLMGNRDRVLGQKFKVTDGLIRSQESFWENGSWSVRGLKITSPGLLAYDGHVDLGLLSMIEAAGSGKTMNEILPELAASLKCPVGQIRDQVAGLAAELVACGLLIPDES